MAVMMTATDLSTGKGYYGTMNQVQKAINISGRKMTFLHKYNVQLFDHFCLCFDVKHVKVPRGQARGRTPKHLQEYHKNQLLRTVG